MATKRGNGANNTLVGTGGADQLYGNGGNDVLRGGDGSDFMKGGTGDDRLYGGRGNDTLWGDEGVDVLFGEDGNDALGGGGAANELYGGRGNDMLTWNPDRINVTEHLASGADGTSVLDGGDGYDTLRIVNDTRYWTDGPEGPEEVASRTLVSIGENPYDPDGPDTVTLGDVFNPNGAFLSAELNGVEAIEVSGAGGLTFRYFDDPLSDRPVPASMKVTGTAQTDAFLVSGGNLTLRGGAGDDQYFIGEGRHALQSEANDADAFVLHAYTGTIAITGFNGAGAAGGDFIEIGYAEGISNFTQTEQAGRTVLRWTAEGEDPAVDHSVTIDATGLVRGVDYDLFLA